MGRPAPGSLQPAHRDETAMNGAQLLIAHSDSSGLMNGPPAWLGFVVSTSQKRDVDHPPVHRDKAAMNGAQLLMAHGDSSGLMNGPPAIRGVASHQRRGKEHTNYQRHTHRMLHHRITYLSLECFGNFQLRAGHPHRMLHHRITYLSLECLDLRVSVKNCGQRSVTRPEMVDRVCGGVFRIIDVKLFVVF
jgi:hypothetical protein